MNTEPENFKTPIYQRNAYKNYIQRKKLDPDFQEKLRASQKSYYQKNREKILLRIKEKKSMKLKETLENPENPENI